jgi:hypothetical protein
LTATRCSLATNALEAIREDYPQVADVGVRRPGFDQSADLSEE